MIDFPHCKINLGLHVIRKRPDGYHDIETCFYPVPWKDVLEIIPSNNQDLVTSGIEVSEDPKNNIVVKAYEILRKDFNMPSVKIHLHKIIPHGAGLGGGSSDGAYTLKLLNDIFNLGISVPDLRQFALKLGSDCPFFIEPTPTLATGRGEVLNAIPLSLSGLILVIVKPGITVSTTEAYAGITPSVPKADLKSLLSGPPTKWRDLLQNDFEETVFKKHPIIAGIKSKLYQLGAMYSSMSGSGSAVYGLFEKQISIREHFSDAIVWQGKLH